MAIKNSTLVIGQRIYTGLYNRGFGTIVAIHGEQAPQTCGVVLGVARTGSRASFDIAFDGGASTERLPETILRGVQWQILDEVVSTEAVAAAVVNASEHRAKKLVEKADADAAHALAVVTLKASPDYSFLSSEGEGQTLAAANIRKHLKHVFPGVKFSVRCPHGTIYVRWKDGPSLASVDAIVDRYANGYFEGMDDSYKRVRSAWTEAFGGAQYVSTSREVSDELVSHAIADAFAVHAVDLAGIERPSVGDYRSGSLYRIPVCTMVTGVRELDALIRATIGATEVVAGVITTSHGEA